MMQNKGQEEANPPKMKEVWVTESAYGREAQTNLQ